MYSATPVTKAVWLHPAETEQTCSWSKRPAGSSVGANSNGSPLPFTLNAPEALATPQATVLSPSDVSGNSEG